MQEMGDIESSKEYGKKLSWFTITKAPFHFRTPCIKQWLCNLPLLTEANHNMEIRLQLQLVSLIPLFLAEFVKQKLVAKMQSRNKSYLNTWLQ